MVPGSNSGAATTARLVFVAAVVFSPSASAAPSLTWPVNEASISCRIVRYALKLYSSEALESMARAPGAAKQHPTAQAMRIVSGRGSRWLSVRSGRGSGKPARPILTGAPLDRSVDLPPARLVTS
jgi:hypothetical protein